MNRSQQLWKSFSPTQSILMRSWVKYNISITEARRFRLYRYGNTMISYKYFDTTN